MNDLITWLHAQLDEDERVAQAACQKGPAEHWQWVADETNEVVTNEDLRDVLEEQNVSLRSVEEYFPDYQTTIPGSTPSFAIGPIDDFSPALPHIARWDPARVLDEVKAKRMVVEVLARCIDHRWTGTYAVVEETRRVLRALALPYADRPGYQPEWAPVGASEPGASSSNVRSE